MKDGGGEEPEEQAVGGTGDEANEHLATEHLHELAGLDAPQCKSAGHDGGGLGADISTHAQGDGYEGGERRDTREHRLEGVDDEHRADARDERGREPRHAPPRGVEGGELLVEVDTAGARHREQVFGVLGLDDVDDVVDGDETDQLVGLVDDREREKVVLGNEPGDLALVGAGADADDLGDHDGLKRPAGVADHKLPQIADADELPVLVDHIEIEGHLDVFVARLERLDGLAAGGGPGEREDVGRHDAAGRVFVIGEERVDLIGVVTLPALEQGP